MAAAHHLVPWGGNAKERKKTDRRSRSGTSLCNPVADTKNKLHTVVGNIRNDSKETHVQQCDCNKGLVGHHPSSLS